KVDGLFLKSRAAARDPYGQKCSVCSTQADWFRYGSLASLEISEKLKRSMLRFLRQKPTRAVSALITLVLLAGCARSSAPVKSFLQEPFPEKLSGWHLFVGTSAGLQPNQGVLPYDLNTPLFSDYASKYRFVWMPPGTSAQYRENEVFDFPVGTILAKSFAFPAGNGKDKEKLIETRLLVRANSGWVGLPYIWNERQTEATLDLAPDPVPISYSDVSGKKREFTYFIPNANECKQCHENSR